MLAMAGSKSKPEPEAPELAGVPLWKFVMHYDCGDLGYARTLVVGSEYSGGVINGICESIVALTEGIVATFAIGAKGLPAPPDTRRRRMLFTAAGYGLLEAS
jgi:hypothetical protein